MRNNLITRQTVCVALGFAIFIVPMLGGWGSALFHAGIPILSLDWTIPGWIAWLVIVPAAFLYVRRRSTHILAVVDDFGRALDALAPDEALSLDCPACGGALPSGARFCVACGHRIPATGRTQVLR